MKWALITGASSGLGEEFAWQLAAEPLNLVLVARRAHRLEALAGKIRATLGVKVEVLTADLSTAAGQNTVIRRLHDESRPVAVLVNNAGFGLGQTFVSGDWTQEEKALELMGRVVARLSWEGARAMLRRVSRVAPHEPHRKNPTLYRAVHFLRCGVPVSQPHGGGVIINVSSATAYTAMGTYAALKTWVRFFSESLSTELRDSGVSVTAVAPGLMHTEFHEAAGMNVGVWPKISFVDPSLVVQETIEAARRRRALVTPTIRYKIVLAASRFAPRWLMRRYFGSHFFNRAL